MAIIDAKDLDREIAFERKTRPVGRGNAGKESWSPAGGIVWAQVRDVLPSRSENTDDGLPVSVRRARIRIRYRDDITPDMRIIYGTRILQIIAGPAELGRREGLELMAEDYSTQGSGA